MDTVLIKEIKNLKLKIIELEKCIELKNKYIKKLEKKCSSSPKLQNEKEIIKNIMRYGII